MVSRLRKEINRRNNKKLFDARKKGKDPDLNKASVAAKDNIYYGSLPFPRKLLSLPHSRLHNNYYRLPANAPTGNLPAGIIPSSTMIKNRHNEWIMMRNHCLWVRVFDIYDKFLFNHINPQSMPASQMLHLCTKLVKHLNLISRTNEVKIQEALGTLEGTIIAQLTPPIEGQVQYHSWDLQNQEDNSSCMSIAQNIEAIAIIRQTKDNIFEGQLIDDMIGTTFQL